jgi:tripartite-type tricarboxylate transporter receptor subunit TctC
MAMLGSRSWARAMLTAVILTVAGSAMTTVALAQAFPSRPIRLIVPYPPGGGTDTVARPLAQKLSESMGQPVLVENRPGASEIIGTEAVARAAPDGYTVLLTTNAFAINSALQRKLPYDTAREFAPVSRLVTTPFMLVVHPKVEASSLRELIALAKARPGKLNFASIGSGTPHHLAMEWLKILAGVDIVAVQYKGVGPGLAAVTAGEVEMMLTGLTAGLAQVRAGKLRALAVTTSTRASAAPDVPTVAEAGLREYDALAWYGLVVPAATPADVIARLNSEVARALGAHDLRERLSNIGVDPAPSTPAELQAVIRDEIRQWEKVIATAGIKVGDQ